MPQELCQDPGSAGVVDNGSAPPCTAGTSGSSSAQRRLGRESTLCECMCIERRASLGVFAATKDLSVWCAYIHFAWCRCGNVVLSYLLFIWSVSSLSGSCSPASSCCLLMHDSFCSMSAMTPSAQSQQCFSLRCNCFRHEFSPCSSSSNVCLVSVEWS